MKYRKIKRYKYQLMRNENVVLPCSFDNNIETDFVKLTKDMLTIKKGYAWDGFTCAPEIKKALKASLVHDVFYQLIKLGLLSKDYRKMADRFLFSIMKECGVPYIICKTYYIAVRSFGGEALKVGSEPEIIEV